MLPASPFLKKGWRGRRRQLLTQHVLPALTSQRSLDRRQFRRLQACAREERTAARGGPEHRTHPAPPSPHPSRTLSARGGTGGAPRAEF